MNLPKRDLTADLALCDDATPGPWKERRGSVWAGSRKVLQREPNARGYGGGDAQPHHESIVANAQFAAEARIGWPHAIERAMAAEAELECIREKTDFDYEVERS